MPALKLTLALVTAVSVTAAAPTPTQAAPALKFVGTPSVRYSGSTVGVVVRLDRALTDRSRTGFVIAPHLTAGEKIGSSFGGLPLGRIGVASRHCYTAEAIQPEPRAKLRPNARWRIGLIVSGKRIARTHAITLRHDNPKNWDREAAKRLGCY